MVKLSLFPIYLFALSLSTYCQPDLVSLADSAGVPTKFDGFKLGMQKEEVKALLSKSKARIAASSDTETIKAEMVYHSLAAKFEFSFPRSGKLSVISCSFTNSLKTQFDKVATIIEKDLGSTIGSRVENLNESFGLSMPELIKERKWGEICWKWKLQDQQQISFVPIVVTRLYWSKLKGKTSLEFDIRMEPLQNYPSYEYSNPNINAVPPK
jgi:hypothetical protein